MLQEIIHMAFQSTLPVRGATLTAASLVKYYGFQSTLPVRGATVQHDKGVVVHGISFLAAPAGSEVLAVWRHHSLRISIHAPREGSDQGDMDLSLVRAISIHAPREGSDQLQAAGSKSRRAFQSTLPVRGATLR